MEVERPPTRTKDDTNCASSCRTPIRGKYCLSFLSSHLHRHRSKNGKKPQITSCCRGFIIELRLGGPAQKCVQIPTWGRLVSPRGEEGRPLTGVCFRPSHANQLQALLTMGLNIPYHQPIYEACVHDLLAGVVNFSTVPSKDARRTCVSTLQLIPHRTVSLLSTFSYRSINGSKKVHKCTPLIKVHAVARASLPICTLAINF